MRALVLAGGGSKGAWQAGAASVLWRAAESAGDPYRIISGTSVGALNAAILAQDRAAERMLAVWRALDQSQVYRARGWVFGELWRGLMALRGRASLYDATPLGELIERHLDVRALERSDRVLLVHAYDLEARAQITFSNRGTCAGEILLGVRASASLPALFQPVRWRGRDLVDGGLVANVPIRSAIAAGADRIDVVTLDAGAPITRVRAEDVPQAAHPPQHRGALQVASDAFDASLDSQVERDVYGVSLVNELLAAGACLAERYRPVALRVFRPGPKDEIGGVLDFGNAHLRRLVERGIAAARAQLA